STQVKLLRLIEERTFRRLGGSRDLSFNGRIVCATNRDLEAMVAEGRFRKDLWFRINVITCTLPPLRDRAEDIPDLLAARVRAAGERFGRPDVKICPDAITAAL